MRYNPWIWLFISGSWHNKLITALTGHPPKLFQLYILGQTFALLVMSIFNIFFVFVFDFNKKKNYNVPRRLNYSNFESEETCSSNNYQCWERPLKPSFRVKCFTAAWFVIGVIMIESQTLTLSGNLRSIDYRSENLGRSLLLNILHIWLMRRGWVVKCFG